MSRCRDQALLDFCIGCSYQHSTYRFTFYKATHSAICITGMESQLLLMQIQTLWSSATEGFAAAQRHAEQATTMAIQDRAMQTAVSFTSSAPLLQRPVVKVFQVCAGFHTAHAAPYSLLSQLHRVGSCPELHIAVIADTCRRLHGSTTLFLFVAQECVLACANGLCSGCSCKANSSPFACTSRECRISTAPRQAASRADLVCDRDSRFCAHLQYCRKL